MFQIEEGFKEGLESAMNSYADNKEMKDTMDKMQQRVRRSIYKKAGKEELRRECWKEWKKEQEEDV